MAAQWSELWTRVRVPGVGPLAALWGEILKGHNAFVCAQDFALGYFVVRVWMGHRYNGNGNFRSAHEVGAAPRYAT